MAYHYADILSLIKKKLVLLDKMIDLKLTDQLKSILITFFISASILMIVFNMNLINAKDGEKEDYYDINPEAILTQEQIKQLEALDELLNSRAETNNAFNETEKSNTFSQAYKTIAPPEDFAPEEDNTESEYAESIEKKITKNNESRIKKEEMSSYEKVNELLKKQKEEGNNSKSSISFSLKDRKKIFIPIPVYLCEVSGRVVVNINVNSDGRVIEAKVNSSQSSSNLCLIEHALEYAKNSKFSTDYSKPSQLGTITFGFIGKH